MIVAIYFSSKTTKKHTLDRQLLFFFFHALKPPKTSVRVTEKSDRNLATRNRPLFFYGKPPKRTPMGGQLLSTHQKDVTQKAPKETRPTWSLFRPPGPSIPGRLRRRAAGSAATAGAAPRPSAPRRETPAAARRSTPRRWAGTRPRAWRARAREFAEQAGLGAWGLSVSQASDKLPFG